MVRVNIKDDESFEALLRRFSKKVQQESIVSETRRRQNFESPTSIRKKKISNKKRKSFRTTQKNQQ
ncbi:MAG: 30S ribosomal protein S21 [Chloroflexi bacterium]|jgi:small subunit ribosomal protein S21|nr:30S ribosomal protein S21 [Chloroflexota bacterium]MAR37294.1 30S ribosomal protein S21 [Chloroflexota bacterium]|tara:strand:+ start:127 stop:324 length:198 start_codon:yes stop_codon:yes gene_type:complete